MRDPILFLIIFRGVRDKEENLEYPLQLIDNKYCSEVDRLKRFLIFQSLITEDRPDIKYEILNVQTSYYVDLRGLVQDGMIRITKEYIEDQNFSADLSRQDKSQIIQQLPRIYILITMKLSYGQAVTLMDILKQKERDTEHLSKIKSDLQLVQNEMNKLKERQERQLKKKQVVDQIDIAILYSNPILHSTNVPIDAIGYLKEIEGFQDAANNCGKELKYRITQATVDNLKNILTMKPKIVHIISHGDYDRDKSLYYLSFEDKGLMQPVYENELVQIMQKSQQFHDFKENDKDYVRMQYPLLVIMSCCHSGYIAKQLQSVIPFAIAVSAQYKIEDTASQVYTVNLYKNLLQSEPLGQAHQNAQRGVKEKIPNAINTCCCAHNHVNNCPFEERSTGNQPLHNEHEPDSTCTCSQTQKIQLKHKWGFHQCQWALAFIEKILGKTQDDLDYIEFIESTLHLKYIKICCCEIWEHFRGNTLFEMQHDESEKFNIYTSRNDDQPDSKHEFRIFDPNRKNGIPEQVQKTTIFKEKLVGRSREVYKLYQYLQVQRPDKEFVIYGKKGTGKSTLAKAGLHYVEVLKIYIKERSFNPDIFTIVDLQSVNKEQFQNTYNDKKQMTLKQFIMFDHVSQGLFQEPYFFAYRRALIDKHIHVIITTQAQGPPQENDHCLILSQFSRDDAEQLLRNLIKQEQTNFVSQENLELILNDTQLLLPSYLEEIAERINNIHQSSDTINIIKEIKQKARQK